MNVALDAVDSNVVCSFNLFLRWLLDMAAFVDAIIIGPSNDLVCMTDCVGMLVSDVYLA